MRKGPGVDVDGEDSGDDDEREIRRAGRVQRSGSEGRSEQMPRAVSDGIVGLKTGLGMGLSDDTDREDGGQRERTVKQGVTDTLEDDDTGGFQIEEGDGREGGGNGRGDSGDETSWRVPTSGVEEIDLDASFGDAELQNVPDSSVALNHSPVPLDSKRPMALDDPRDQHQGHDHDQDTVQDQSQDSKQRDINAPVDLGWCSIVSFV